MQPEYFACLLKDHDIACEDLKVGQDKLRDLRKVVDTSLSTHKASLAALTKSLPPFLFMDDDNEERPLQFVVDYTADPTFVWDWDATPRGAELCIRKMGTGGPPTRHRISRKLYMGDFMLAFGNDTLYVVLTDSYRPTATTFTISKRTP